MDTKITYYLDTRYAKQGNTYPLKFRVWNRATKKAKLYETGYDFTEKEFASVWKSQKIRKKDEGLNKRLQSDLSEVRELADSINPFTFETFERNRNRTASDTTRVQWHYKDAIVGYYKNDQAGTAENYDSSLKSLAIFSAKNIKGRKAIDIEALQFSDIDVGFLNAYEKYMLDEGKSISTVAIYLRPLRAVFNNAIEAGDIDRKIYPFGKRKYQIPSVRNTKKALSREQLKKLFEAVPQTPEQERAKDFWFLSYNLNGLNLKDIALLKNPDIEDGVITIFRAKSMRTKKQNLSKLVIHLNGYSTRIIEKYRNPDTEPGAYIFPIFTPGMDATGQRRTIKNFAKFVNQHMKKLAITNGITGKISNYYARHSFATQGIRNGASKELMQELLGHESYDTTEKYFAGFDDETRKEFAESLMDF